MVSYRDIDGGPSSSGGSAPKLDKKTMYALGAVGALAAIYVVRKRSSATVSAPAIDTTDTADANDVTTDPGYSPASGSATGVSASAFGFTPITTNAMWAQNVSQILQSHGYDPSTVDSAIGHYLGGVDLTQAELDIVQAAIGLEGQPPVSVPSPRLKTNQGQTGTSPAVPKSLPSQAQARAASPALAQLYAKYQNYIDHYNIAIKAGNKQMAAQYLGEAQQAQSAYESAYNIYANGK